MLTKTILEQLTGNGMVDALVTVLTESMQDFADVQKKYLDAMDVLRAELGDNVSPSAQDEMRAIEKQTASNLLFSGFLGLKENLDNFIDPAARNFLEVDSDIYLRERMARMFPEYQNAQNTRNRFYALLSPAQREVYEAVIAYTSYLETVGPKLAHYYGYILGNDLLPWVIPGYYADPVQTARYTAMLQEYFGKEILKSIGG